MLRLALKFRRTAVRCAGMPPYLGEMRVACIGCSGGVSGSQKFPDQFCYGLAERDCCEVLMCLTTHGEPAGCWWQAAVCAGSNVGSSLILTVSAPVGQMRSAQISGAVLGKQLTHAPAHAAGNQHGKAPIRESNQLALFTRLTLHWYVGSMWQRHVALTSTRLISA